MLDKTGITDVDNSTTTTSGNSYNQSFIIGQTPSDTFNDTSASMQNSTLLSIFFCLSCCLKTENNQEPENNENNTATPLVGPEFREISNINERNESASRASSAGSLFAVLCNINPDGNSTRIISEPLWVPSNDEDNRQPKSDQLLRAWTR